MQHRIAAVVLLCALGAGVAYAQLCDDPMDNILCVYQLTAQEEAQFSSADGQLCLFWNNWSGRDYFELIPPDNCYPGRCNFVGGESDAKITCRAAGSARGLYLYLAVQDNVWVDRANDQDIGADATDMFLDRLDAATLGSCTDCRIGLYGSYLSYTTNQFQVWMGATALPPSFQFQCYDPLLWSWTPSTVTWASAKTVYGFEAEVVQVDATHKTQEWFFPWEKLGDATMAVGTVLADRRFGFTGGYNDKDGDNAVGDDLRWTGKDPWASDANYWGDLLLPATMPPVASYLSTQAARAHAAATAGARTLVGSEFYTLDGRTLSAAAVSALRSGTIVLQVRSFADGSRRSAMVKVGR